MSDGKERCEGCTAMVPAIKHACPFEQEANDDNSDFCNCCDDCVYACERGL